VLQYGYGDENNSFPLILDEQVYSNSWPSIKAKLREFAPKPLPMALATTFEGTLVWGPSYPRQNTQTPSIYLVPTESTAATTPPTPFLVDGRRRRSIFDGLMLRAGGAFDWERAPSYYYSAYLWVMFEICDAAGAPRYDRPEDRWQSLLPLFEHCNAAEGQTLNFLKQRLAEKARNVVEKLEREYDVRFRYLCAIDDSGGVRNKQGMHRVHFRIEDEEDSAPRNETFKENQAPKQGPLLPIENQRLRNMLIAELPDDAARTRMFAPHLDQSKIMTSCDLPDIIEDFYRNFIDANAHNPAPASAVK
jgi:hypothetical protein